MSDRTTISVSKTAAEVLKATADMFGISQSQLVEDLSTGLNSSRHGLQIIKAEFGKIVFSELIIDGLQPVLARADVARCRKASEELVAMKAKEKTELISLDAALRAALAAGCGTWVAVVDHVYTNYHHTVGALDNLGAGQPEFYNSYYYESLLLNKASRGGAFIKSTGEIIRY